MLFDRGVTDMLEIIDGSGKDAESTHWVMGREARAIQVAVALKLRCLGVATIGAPVTRFIHSRPKIASV